MKTTYWRWVVAATLGLALSCAGEVAFAQELHRGIIAVDSATVARLNGIFADTVSHTQWANVTGRAHNKVRAAARATKNEVIFQATKFHEYDTNMPGSYYVEVVDAEPCPSGGASPDGIVASDCQDPTAPDIHSHPKGSICAPSDTDLRSQAITRQRYDFIYCVETDTFTPYFLNQNPFYIASEARHAR